MKQHAALTAERDAVAAEAAELARQRAGLEVAVTIDDVRKAIYRASSLAEIETAEQLVADWLEKHPDDHLLEAESLEMKKLALKELGVESVEELRRRRHGNGC